MCTPLAQGAAKLRCGSRRRACSRCCWRRRCGCRSSGRSRVGWLAGSGGSRRSAGTRAAVGLVKAATLKRHTNGRKHLFHWLHHAINRVGQFGKWVVGKGLLHFDRFARINELIDIRWHQTDNSRMQGCLYTPPSFLPLAWAPDSCQPPKRCRKS